MTQPDWAASFFELLNPAAVVLAFILPFSRALIRKIRGDDQSFVFTLIVNDVAAGFTLPSFIALVLCPMLPGVLEHIQTHILQFAGAIGILHILREIFGKRERRWMGR